MSRRQAWPIPSRNIVRSRSCRRHRRYGLVDTVPQIEKQRAGIGEVAHVGEIGTFADVEAIDCFRHQPIQIGIALAVSMRR